MTNNSQTLLSHSMTAKQRVVKFLKECEMEGKWQTKVDMHDGIRVLQCMRTELSRMRNQAKAYGLVPKPFKMMKVSIVTVPPAGEAEGFDMITLKKTQLPHQADAEQLVPVMREIVVEAMVDDDKSS